MDLRPLHVVDLATSPTGPLCPAGDRRQVAWVGICARPARCSSTRPSSADFLPCVAGLEVCEKLLAQFETTRTLTEEFPVRHFLRIRRTLDGGGPGNGNRSPGPEYPAGGLTKVKSDTAPLLRLLQSESPRPGARRPLRGVASVGGLSLRRLLAFPS